MASYVETNDGKFAIQISNFGSKIGTYQTLFGLTDSEVKSAQQDAVFYQWTVNTIEKVDTFKRNWTSFKNFTKKGGTYGISDVIPEVVSYDAIPPIVTSGVLFRFTTLVNRIKAHQNYTEGIGQNLGIELTAAQKLDMAGAQPVLKGGLNGNKVVINWKKGQFDALIIEKDSGNGFVTLDKALRAKYTDNSPMPAQGETAVWKYRAMYCYGDTPVGLWSNILLVTVTS